MKFAWMFLLLAIPFSNVSAAQFVRQSSRAIPVAYRTDVVVLGGSVAAVAAACEAAVAGRDVVLVAPRTYLGDALCENLTLWLEDDQSCDDPLLQNIFGSRRVTTPLRAKRALEQALLDAHVTFLLASFPTDLLRDEAGELAGVVIANRAGRQAIVAQVVVDATPLGTVAHLAGAPLRESAGHERVLCRRVVLGPDESAAPAETPLPALTAAWQPARVIPAELSVRGVALSYYVYQQPVLASELSSFAKRQNFEQAVRDATYRPGQLRASARTALVPPEAIVGRSSEASWTAAAPQLGCFQPRGMTRLYVLSALADVPRRQASRLWQPTVQVQAGRQVGRAAAEEASQSGRARRSRSLPGRLVARRRPVMCANRSAGCGRPAPWSSRCPRPRRA